MCFTFSPRFDESFFTFCGKELTKINTFYAEKLAEATRKFATLKNEMEGDASMAGGGKKKFQQRRRKVMDLKLAFSEFYLSLILLQNYQNLNFTGFRKILKKHDKLVKNEAGARWREDYVECAHFHTNKVILIFRVPVHCLFAQCCKAGAKIFFFSLSQK